jgi:hypothetical protein
MLGEPLWYWVAGKRPERIAQIDHGGRLIWVTGTTFSLLVCDVSARENSHNFQIGLSVERAKVSDLPEFLRFANLLMDKSRAS